MKYNKKIVDKICELISTGEYTIVAICNACGIHKDTYFSWKNTNSDFSDRIKKAESEWFDAIKVKARSGLAINLEKHEYEETSVEYIEGKDGRPKIKSQKKVKKVIMPNMTAVIYTLNNQDSENFKQRQVIAHTGADDGPLQNELVLKIGYGQKDESQDD